MGTILGRKVYQPFAGTIRFRCPACDSFHQIQIDGSRGWTWNGDADRPTVSPSLLVTYNGKDAGIDDAPPAVCHTFIRDGQWHYLTDCTHALAGQIVDVPDYEIGVFD
jgi:hypothetical protein